jgi:hypothetical protein
MDERLDRSRNNALSAISQVANDYSIDVKNMERYLERLVDIGFNHQFNDLDRSGARSELKDLLDEIIPFFEGQPREN